MSTRSAFPFRSRALLQLSILALCLVPLASGQHGGGGGGHFGGVGHFGGHLGGHFSGHHSGGNRTGRHFHWMRLGFGKHSATKTAASDFPSSLWNFSTPLRSASFHRMPATMLWSPPESHSGLPRRVTFTTSPMRSRHGYYRRHFPPFTPSGCFFNGASQVCFFEPLFCFSAFDDGFDFGGDWFDGGGDSGGMGPVDTSDMTPPPASFDNTPSNFGNGNSAVSAAASEGATRDWDLGKGEYVLVLQNGTTHVVTQYWAADGYLEYISPDGTRSHIPLEALDLQSTVVRNEQRGLPFVLRSTPPTSQ